MNKNEDIERTRSTSWILLFYKTLTSQLYLKKQAHTLVPGSSSKVPKLIAHTISPRPSKYTKLTPWPGWDGVLTYIRSRQLRAHEEAYSAPKRQANQN
jgi:hypothetical protein